jgi:hypothetical protein
MIRPLLQALGLVAALVHCSSTRSPAQAVAPASARDGQFGTEEQKLTACLDLRDHIVNLYADQYVAGEGASLSSLERAAFRDGWAEELAKRGTFDRFERSCFYGVTPRKYECGMMSRTTDGLVACMKLSSL